MLIKKYGATNKGKQRICVITDARFPIKVPYEGTKEEQVLQSESIGNYVLEYFLLFKSLNRFLKFYDTVLEPTVSIFVVL